MSKDIKFDYKKWLNKLLAIFEFVKQYIVIIFIVILVCIFSFLVLRINSLAGSEPSEDEVTEQLLTVKRLRIDQSAVDKILELKDSNVSVKVLFDKYRNNPFQE